MINNPDSPAAKHKARVEARIAAEKAEQAEAERAAVAARDAAKPKPRARPAPPPPSANFAALVGGLVEDSGEPAGARLKELAVAEIYEDPDNPRTAFDQGELDDLAASIKAHGLLQPITVRPRDERGHMIRFGARRFRASQQAGLARITAVITDAGATEADALAAQVIENDQREGLSTADMARAVGRLLGLGLSQAEVGEKLGRPKDQISMFAAVNDMPPVLQALAPTHGVRTLYELFGAWKRDAGRAEAFIQERGEHGVTTAEARALASSLRSPAPTVAQGGAAVPLASPAAEPESPAAPPRDRRRPAEASAAKPAPIGGFDVDVNGRPGRLVLEAGPDPQTVLVLFGKAKAAEPTPIADVRLLRARAE